MLTGSLVGGNLVLLMSCFRIVDFKLVNSRLSRVSLVIKKTLLEPGQFGIVGERSPLGHRGIQASRGSTAGTALRANSLLNKRANDANGSIRWPQGLDFGTARRPPHSLF
jgi:hypothetical protein